MEFGPFPPPIIYEVESNWGGFVLERIKSGQIGRIEVVGFHSFDEGIGFYNLLDNLNGLLRKAGILPSSVDRLVLVVEQKKTTLYVNQMFATSVQIRAKRPMNAGAWVGEGDIAGIERVRLHGVTIPDDAGVLLLLSHNWRRAFFFDFRPHHPQLGYKRDYDIEVMAGQLFSHLVYTEYFLLSEKEWDSVISAGWFPFMYLVGGLWDSLIETIRQGDSLDDDEKRIFEAFSVDIDAKLVAWLTKPILKQEEQILTRAITAFKSEDWVTLISLVCPRIEGILRRSFSSYGPQRQVIERLREHVAAAGHEKSLLFPAQLQRYFADTFFQFVDFSVGEDTLNRHTFAHGIASPESMDRSHGLRLMLLVDHLFYCLPA